MNGSIMSFKERGPWGDASWPGNVSGYVLRDLFLLLKPSLFVDPMKGCGTSIEVAQEMGIRAVGLDLAGGFDILTESIVERVGEEACLVASHPPYGSAVDYPSHTGTSRPHADLSRSGSLEEFEERLHLAVLNQRNATRAGGHYAIIIGDQRKDGQYFSFQADIITRMPRSELAAVFIKTQHNVRSEARQYPRLRYPRIAHEYVVLWQKAKALQSWIGVLSDMARAQHLRLRSAWRAVVRSALVELGGRSDLRQLYATIERNAPANVAANHNWRAKVRQTCQLDPNIRAVDRGVWELAK